MLIEAALAISLAGTGPDLLTSEVGRRRGFGERNVFCSSTGRCIAYTGVYTILGTLASEGVNKKWGPKAGLITVGVFCVVPFGAALTNTIKLSKRKK